MTEQAHIISSHKVDRCILCNSDGRYIYHNLNDRFGNSQGAWNIKACNNKKCNLLWLDPAPDENELWKAYDSYYTHVEHNSIFERIVRPVEKKYLAKRFGYYQGNTTVNNIIGLLAYLIPTERCEMNYKVLELSKTSENKLLDIGCGNGTFISTMNNLGWDCEGIEIDKKAVEYCNSKGLKVHHGQLDELNLQTKYFDVVTINHVIEHVYNPEEFIKEVHRILKPNGKLIIATPNAKSWLFRVVFKSQWYCLDPPRHLNLFNRNNLQALVEKTGFAVMKNKTSARNEFWIYTSSKAIRKKGTANISEDSSSKKINLIIGKIIQQITLINLFFNKDAGSEIYISAQKK